MSHNLPATARDLRADDNLSRSSRQLVDPPSSLCRRAPLRSETALPEANSFPCGCQPFCCIPIGFFGVIWGVLVACSPMVPQGGRRELLFSRMCELAPLRQTEFDPAKSRQYPQTVARKSAIRLRPRSLGTAPASSKTYLRPTRGRTQWSSVSGRMVRIRGECRGQGQADLPAE